MSWRAFLCRRVSERLFTSQRKGGIFGGSKFHQLRRYPHAIGRLRARLRDGLAKRRKAQPGGQRHGACPVAFERQACDCEGETRNNSMLSDGAASGRIRVRTLDEMTKRACSCTLRFDCLLSEIREIDYAARRILVRAMAANPRPIRKRVSGSGTVIPF